MGNWRSSETHVVPPRKWAEMPDALDVVKYSQRRTGGVSLFASKEAKTPQFFAESNFAVLHAFAA